LIRIFLSSIADKAKPQIESARETVQLVERFD
jgi:transcriptional regulator